ncbi:MFS transporter [Bacteriovorax sp. Seq25_V]|uniref:MFS transporter n=1 Tax=Bacteriovorax sp. Seq25_V TaxID=1201288 RepID=UPI00038A167F|nr:MFS transporter [Bacteriovorax sp. Seq25_V]EQC47395.1 transporter, major facilitator family protein [Bacteriovorax sp. Seq25_V]
MALPKVLKYPNFKKLYLAGLTSELGSFITETALMLVVFELSSNNKSYLGAARAVFLFFLTLGNILGGALGEKFNRRNLLLFTNYGRIPLVASLFFIKDVYWIIAVDGLIALFTGIYNPTRQTLVNDIVPQKDIPKANALFGSTFAILHMLGPFLGATLYSTFKGIHEVLSFDLFTYFIGIYLIGTIHYTPPKKEESGKSIIRESYEGFTYISKNRDLVAVVSNAIVAGFCIGFLIPLMLPYFLDVLKLDEQAYGITFSFFGLGGVIGGWVSQKFHEKYLPGKMIVWSLCTEPILMLLWLYIPGFYSSLIIFLLWGIAVFVRITSQLNYVSIKVDSKYLSRVFALLDLSFVFPNIASGIIISIIGDKIDTVTILKTIAIIFAVCVFPRLLFKDMKSLYNSNSEAAQRDTSIQDKIEG